MIGPVYGTDRKVVPKNPEGNQGVAMGTFAGSSILPLLAHVRFL